MKTTCNTNNIFYKVFRFEVKRYFVNIPLIIIACIVPVLLITTLLGSLLPLLFKGAELNDIYVALYNEDPVFETDMIIRHLTESDSVEDFVKIIDVDSLDEGKNMLENNEASALVHIPLGLQESLYHGQSETLSFYAGNTNRQITALLYDMLKSGLDNINSAQSSVDIIYYAMQDMGYERQEAAEKYSEMAEDLFFNIISRSDIYAGYSEVSATGDYLNIEYYLISTMLLCLFFLGLAISAKFSGDKEKGILSRGGFHHNSFGYILAKTLSGAVFLLLPLVLTVVYILIITGSFGLFSGNAVMLALTILVCALYFSAIMVCIGSVSRSSTTAVWAGFSLALVVSMFSGIFIPRNLMPRGMSYVAEITGLPSVIRLFGSSLFGVKNTSVVIDLLKIMGVIGAVFGLGYYSMRKRINRL